MQKKVNLVRKILGLNLTEKDLEVLYYFFDETWEDGNTVELTFFEWTDSQTFNISDETLIQILKALTDHWLIHSQTYMWWGRYNINTNWIQLIRAIKAEENKTWREKFLDITTTFKNFISILIALWALIVSIIALIQK